MYMKHILFLLAFCLSLTQSQGQSSPPSVSGYFVVTNQLNTGASTIYSRDTLVNLDTVIVNLFVNEYKLWKIDAIIRCDSISGATTGSAILQAANTGVKSLTSNQVMWYPVTTATLDGAGRTQYRITGDLTSSRARLFLVTPNSTARRMMMTYAVTLKRYP